MVDIRQGVLEIVSTVLEKAPGEISLDAYLVQEVGADSMMALEILAALEKKYRIVIPEEKLIEMTTVNKIIQLTEQSMKGGKKK
jgi:acyl carrier protein